MRSQFLPSRAFALSLLLALTGATIACGQGYHLVKIVDELTPRPDGAGNFAFNGSFSATPTLDNGKIVFRPGGADSIWAANLNGTGLAKLVGLDTPAPGGMGDFTALAIGNTGGLPIVKDGAVVFPATSASSDPNVPDIGLYAVPVGGGAVQRIADRNTLQPDDSGGLTFNTFGDPNANTGNFSVSMGKVAFVGSNKDGGGIFLANTDGTGLAALADGSHPAHPEFDFPVKNFGVPALYNGTTAFYGGTVFDPSNGYNALYTTGGAFVYNERITSNAHLPGNADASPHTRFDVPPFAYDGTRIAFIADDADSSPDYRGLFTLPPGGGGSLRQIVNFANPLPGLDANGFGVNSFALDNGTLAIAASDDDGHTAIYTAPADGSAPPVRLCGSGDGFDGGNGIIGGVSLLPGSLSNGDIGVMIYYSGNQPDSSAFAGIYVLTPGARKPVVGGVTQDSTDTNSSYSYRIVADNFPRSYGAVGMPPGLHVDSGTGIITGVAAKAGTYKITLKAANSVGTGTGTLTLTVRLAPPRINSADMVRGTTGTAFSYQITATGNPTSYGVLGLPQGLTVDGKTGVISGTPVKAGTFKLTLKATNAAGTGQETLTLTVAMGIAAPVVTSATTANAVVNEAFSYQIAATNNPTSYNVVGLPGGVTVNVTTGLISGTPTEAGRFPLTLKATNAAGTGTGTLTLTVTSAAPVVISAKTAHAVVGEAFSYQITATNNPTSFSVLGLPAGLTVDTKTGVITGTPTVHGTFTLTLEATNSGGTGKATLTLTIAAQ